MKKFIFAIAILLLFPNLVKASYFKYQATGEWSSFYGYNFPNNKYKNKDKHQLFLNLFEVNISAEKELNNNYSFGIYADLMASINKRQYNYSNGLWGHEIYAIFDNPAGRIMLGETYNTASQFHVGAPKSGRFGLNDSDIVNFMSNPNWLKEKHHTAYKTLNSTEINTDGTAAKLSYISPEFYNLTLGLSYVPDTYSRTGLINRDARYADDDGYVAAAYYHNDFDFAEMESSLSYAIFNKDDKEISLGLSFYRAGWTVGGSYRKTYVDGNDYSITINSINPRLPDLFDNYREGQAWDIGVGYEIGPYKVALSYFESKSDNSDNKDKIWLLSNEYQINKHVALYLAGGKVDFEGINTEQSNKGYSVISGFSLSF